VRRDDSLTTFMCRLSWNLGASTSWNPQGLSRPVIGLLYILNVNTTAWGWPIWPKQVATLKVTGFNLWMWVKSWRRQVETSACTFTIDGLSKGTNSITDRQWKINWRYSCEGTEEEHEKICKHNYWPGWYCKQGRPEYNMRYN